MSVSAPDPSAAAELDAALNEAVAPVIKQLDRLAVYIDKREAELASLKGTRKRAEKVLAALDPDNERLPQRKDASPELKKVLGEKAAAVRKEKLDRVEQYVRARPGERIAVTSLNGDKSLDGISRAMLGELLTELADQGVLRLDHVGKGGSKQYLLVA